MRRVMPKHSIWQVMQFDTLRLRLIKLAARVIELKTQVKIHLPSSAPDRAIFAMLLNRCRASSPESRGVMARNRPPFFKPSADQIRKTNPPPRRRSLMRVAQGRNQNANVRHTPC